ncbi:MAG: PQQ-binding-like beta-propeller repeat protein, partial [Planctomycetales bacterium]
RRAMMRLRMTDGKLIWSKNVFEVGQQGGAVYPHWFTASEGRIFGLGKAWDSSTGKPLWEHPLPGSDLTAVRLIDQLKGVQRTYPVRPTARGDRVYFPTMNGQLRALDCATGRPLWIWRIGPGQAARALAQDEYLIASTLRRVVCLRRESSVKDAN